jgi:hypothetical protein
VKITILNGNPDAGNSAFDGYLEDLSHLLVINSDFVLFASPVIMGFYSALLKKVTDKLIPLVHPYIVVDQGEAHHRARYDRHPLLGLLLEKGDDADEDDVKIVSDIHSRTALNLKTRLAFTRLTLDPIGEVAREINSL